jgi:iron complex outermembrane receptor protein
MEKYHFNAPTLLLAWMFSCAVTANPDFVEGVFTDMNLLDEPMMDIPIVLTAARLRQSQLDTPASVTVIDAQTIAALGFKDIEEVFRLVPGMLVGYHSSGGEKSPSVSYHGTQAAEHRRLQVLIDGRSIYKPALAQVSWANIPLAIEDIDRIEVIRGPSSAIYGANAYLGTINILTKHPNAKQGISAKFRAGNRHVADAYINVSGKISQTDVHVTLADKHKSGFDYLEDGENNNRDSVSSLFTQIRTFTQLNTHSSIEWQTGIKTGVSLQNYSDGIEYVSEADVKAQDSFVWSKYNYEFSGSQFSHLQVYSQSFKQTQEWRACGSINGFDICGNLDSNTNESKSEIEYQHTSTWNNQLRTVAGMRLRLDEFDSKTYNNGRSDNLNSSAFTSIEYQLSDRVLLNLSGMYESDDLNGNNFSPRVAINYHLSSIETLRFIYSQAIRSPSLYEKHGQRSVVLTNATVNGSESDDYPYSDMLNGNSELLNEKIYSHEISYFGLMPKINGQLDVKVFYDELSGLISEGLSFENPLSNQNKIVQQGFEGQLTCNIDNKNKILFSFSRLQTKDDFAGNTDEIKKESRLSADSSGSLAWLRTLQSNTNVGAVYYHINNWGGYVNSEGVEFSRLDLNINHNITLPQNYQVKLQGTVQYRLDDDVLLYSNNNYNDDVLVYASMELNF